MGITQENSVYLAAGVRSSGSTADLFGSSNEGVSFELWFKPATVTTSNANLPIFTFGLPDFEGLSEGGLSSCEINGFDFQLSQRNGHLEIAYLTSELYSEPCQVYRLDELPLLEPGKLAHVVVSLSDMMQQVFVNGHASAVLKQSFSNGLQHWNANYDMQLFGYDYPVPTQWVGSLYELAIYRSPLFLSDVADRILVGLPPALPSSFNFSVVVNEDAEDVAGSHSLDWYQQQAPFEDRGRFVLTYQSMNKEVQDLQQKLNMPVPEPLPPVHIYVTSLPFTGRLFQANGIALDHSDLISR
jgi:hypothetical protein